MSSDFLLIHRTSAKRELLAVAGILVILFCVRYEAILSLSTHLLGGAEGDVALYTWLIRSNVSDLFSLPWFNTRAFYPYSQTLAWSDNFILPSLVAWPFLALGAPLILIFNSIILLASFLNGWCTYRLCVQLTGRTMPSFIAGAAFMTYPFFTFHLGHPQLQFFFWIPLTLSALFSFLSHPRFLPASQVGFSVSLSFLCAVYYAIFALLVIGVAILLVAVLRPHRLTRSHALILFFGVLIGLLPLLSVVFPYFSVRSVFGERGIYEAWYFSATALSYLSSVPLSLLYGWSAKFSHAEANLFPGIAILVLSLSAIVRVWGAKPLRPLLIITSLLLCTAAVLTVHTIGSPFLRMLAALLLWIVCGLFGVICFRLGLLERKLGFHIMTNRGIVAIFLGIALFFFALSLGPLGNPERGEWAIGIYRVVYETFPGFNALRAIGRSGVVVIFALHVVGALTLALLRDSKRFSLSIMSLVFALTMTENLVTEYPLEPLKQKPLVFDYIAHKLIDHRQALIVLPMAGNLTNEGSVASWGEFARMNTNYMHWAFETGHPLVNGYSGQRTKLMREFPGQLYNFPDQRSLLTLRSIVGLRYVVYMSSLDPNFRKESFETRVNQTLGGLRLVMSDAAGNYLFELVGELRLRSDTTLLMPSYPAGGRFHLELKTLYQADGKPAVIDIIAPDISAELPLASASLLPTGDWQSFMIELPRSSDKVRPFRVTFRSHSDAPIYFGETTYELPEKRP